MTINNTIRVAVIPASTKTGHAAISALLADPRKPRITGYYRNLAKAPRYLAQNPDFTAVQGDISDSSSVVSFDADAVLAITPPRQSPGDGLVKHARIMSENVKNAVLRSKSVKRLVYLSSLGANLDQGVGEIKSNNVAEAILADAAFEVVFIRAAYFMENWASSIPSAQSAGILRSTIPLDWSIPMVAIHDIAQACTHVLLARFSGAGRRSNPMVFEMHGPRSYNATDVANAFSAAAGHKVDVEIVPGEQLAQFFSDMHIPVNFLPEFVEMTRAFLPGGVMAKEVQEVQEENVRRGDRELADVVKEMWDGVST